ncbi:MAG: TetR/AcrR family transcriptional regulator [Neisseriaceae bacterium]|nr:TetR/AcrR family transcriptional regulator [Neisseriaceae bacterium]
MDAKTAILNTAESLFNQKGYAAVGVDLIRDRVPVSKTTLYRHFRGKNDLIHAVLTRRDDVFQTSLRTAAEQAPSGYARLQAIFSWHQQWFQSATFNGCLFQKALAELGTEDPLIAQLAQRHKRQIAALIAANLPATASEPSLWVDFLMAQLEGSNNQVVQFGPDDGRLSACHRLALTYVQQALFSPPDQN